MTENKTYPKIHELELGPTIGGVATQRNAAGRMDPAYHAVYSAFEGVRKGDLVAVRIPGMSEFVTEFTRDGPWINVMGLEVALSDRCNGVDGKPGQMWTARLAKPTKSRLQAVKDLPEGTLFFISPPSVPHRAVFLRTDVGVHNLSAGRDVELNEYQFGTVIAEEGFPFVIGKQGDK